MLGATLLLSLATTQDPARALVGVECIWDRTEHQAFTDLAQYGDQLLVTFREGSDHAGGRDGVVRVLASDDGGLNWRAAALLEEEGVDLRDPKLCITPEGRVMVVMGGSVYDGRTLTGRRPRVAFGEGAPLRFGSPRVVTVDPAVAGPQDWLWRVTWSGETGYGVVYQPDRSPWGLHLVSTKDGLTYDHVVTLDVDGDANETTLRFQDDGTMIALVRRESGDRTAWVGHARAPYTSWSWAPLPVAIGGPNLVVLEDGRLLVAGREYVEGGPYTMLGEAGLDGTWRRLLRLPSGRDTSYPGLVVRGERLLCSYYSGHEGKTSVYLARLRVPNLLAR